MLVQIICPIILIIISLLAPIGLHVITNKKGQLLLTKVRATQTLAKRNACETMHLTRSSAIAERLRDAKAGLK